MGLEFYSPEQTSETAETSEELLLERLTEAFQNYGGQKYIGSKKVGGESCGLLARWFSAEKETQSQQEEGSAQAEIPSNTTDVRRGSILKNKAGMHVLVRGVFVYQYRKYLLYFDPIPLHTSKPCRLYVELIDYDRQTKTAKAKEGTGALEIIKLPIQKEQKFLNKDQEWSVVK